MNLQVLNGNPYNRKCDVYSFGICLWEIYCCDMPYPDLTFSEVTSAVVRQVYVHTLITVSLKENPISWHSPLLLATAEFETRDSPLLSKRSSECDEEVLGRKPWQAAWNGRGGFHDRGHWHIEGRRHDSHRSSSGLSVFPQVPRSVRQWNLLEHGNCWVGMLWSRNWNCVQR